MSSLSKISRLGMSAVFMGVAMFTSSCSKDEAQAPEPRIEAVNEASGLRDGGGTMTLLKPSLATTNGPTCNGCFANGWTRRFNGTESENAKDAFDVPAGTSTLTALWGNNTSLWINPLPTPSGPGTIITSSALQEDPTKGMRAAVIQTKIKNLQPGKKYQVTVQISTSRTINSLYAKSAEILVGGDGDNTFQKVDFTNTPGQWITKTLTFTATNNESELWFTSQNVLGRCYANLYVGNDAVKKID